MQTLLKNYNDKLSIYKQELLGFKSTGSFESAARLSNAITMIENFIIDIEKAIQRVEDDAMFWEMYRDSKQ